jgi:RHS repeat-associated protein
VFGVFCFGSPFTFTGELMDINDLLYLRARYYSPALGVFTALDPVENLNRYLYVNANPANRVDPSGLQEIEFECAMTCWAMYPISSDSSGQNGNDYNDCYLDCLHEQYQDLRDIYDTPSNCGWNDLPQLKLLMPEIEYAAQRWNRFSAADIARFPFLLNDACKAMNVLSSLPASCASTGLSNDAFAAIMVARLHEEGKLRLRLPISEDPVARLYGIKEVVGDWLGRLGIGTSIGIANIRSGRGNAADQIIHGQFPPNLLIGSFNTDRFRHVGQEDYIDQYDTAQTLGPGSVVDFLNRDEVSIELLAADLYRGIIATRSDATVPSGPTIFNLGTWTLAGMVQDYSNYGGILDLNEVAPVKNGLHIMNHVAMILEGPCDLGLKATPWVDFEYYNAYDATYITNWDEFLGTRSPNIP